MFGTYNLCIGLLIGIVRITNSLIYTLHIARPFPLDIFAIALAVAILVEKALKCPNSIFVRKHFSEVGKIHCLVLMNIEKK